MKGSIGTLALHSTIKNMVHIVEIAGVEISGQNGEDSKSLNNDPYVSFFHPFCKPLMYNSVVAYMELGSV